MDKKQFMNEKYKKPNSAYLLIDIANGDLKMEHCGDVWAMLNAIVNWFGILKLENGITFEELIGAMNEIHNDIEDIK